MVKSCEIELLLSSVTAIGKGDLEARWLAAASRSLVGPGLRDASCVPDQDHQADTLKALSKGDEPAPPKTRPCREPSSG